VEQYDQHFWRNGHALPIVVFDDSSPANQEKYFHLLEHTRTHNDLYYVGPREKEHFIAYLNERLRDARLEGLVRNLFRPSYGGNRNCTLMYTLGGLMISSDDDMRPFALMEDSPESLGVDEISRGRLHKAGRNHVVHKSFDIVAAFTDVLGTLVADIPENFERGELLRDSAMDLETNATKGLTVEAQLDPDAVNDLYVLVNFRPVVTNRNWRMDCGVAGYDNTFGLPPFFPTRLRFEDYIYRLWVQQDGVVAAHVDAAQHHTRSSYMRNPPASEIFNEEVSNLIKRKIKASVTRLDELSVAFDYSGEVTAADAQEVLDKIVSLHTRALDAVPRASSTERADALRLFASNLHKAFYGFEPDFFQQNLVRIVDDVVTVIKGSIELWPTLVEISYFQKERHGLPRLRVQNQRAGGRK
jgi:hypothetical protein